jgi:tyrosyl-tRNA synthetase
VHALATSLITKPDGTKYGKTEGGAIWLSADLMSPYAFYQFWLNVSDAEVPGLLRVFSFKSREEIEELVRESAERPAARLGQRALAEELTTLVHGADETRRAIAASQALFGRSDLAEVDERTLAAAVEEVPSARVFGAAGLRGEGNLTAVPSVLGPDGTEVAAASSRLPTVADLMAEIKIVPSKSAARRAIAAGGAYLNNRKVTSEDAAPTAADLLYGRYLILRVGKRTVGAVEVLSR